MWKEKWERTVSRTVWACKDRARGIQTKWISRFFGRISSPGTSQQKMRHFWAQATLGSEEPACCVGRPSSFLLCCHEQDCCALPSNSDPCFSATSHRLLSPFYSTLLFPVGNDMNYLLLVLFLTRLNGKSNLTLAEWSINGSIHMQLSHRSILRIIGHLLSDIGPFDERYFF